MYIFRAEKNTVKKNTIFIVSGLAVASWFQYWPVPCFRHVFWGIAPSLLVLGYFFDRVSRQNGLFAAFVLGVIFLPSVSIKASQAKAYINADWRSIDAPRFLRGIMYRAPLEQYNEMYGSNCLSALAFGQYIAEVLPEVPFINDTFDGGYAALALNEIHPDEFFTIINPAVLTPTRIKRRKEFVNSHRPVIIMHIWQEGGAPVLPTEMRYLKFKEFLTARVVYYLPIEYRSRFPDLGFGSKVPMGVALGKAFNTY
jgi:hypothetical protein